MDNLSKEGNLNLDSVNIKREKIKKWLKDPYNQLLLGILILAFFIRIYYFNLTANQPLWWDELSFGDLAKNFIHHNWDNLQFIQGETRIRPFLFSSIWSILIFLGINDSSIKFFLEFLPSILSVFFIYLIGKEIYDKKIALIATFIISVSWIHVFYSMRMMTSIPALCLSLASILYFFKSIKSESIDPKYFGISVFSLSVAVLIRYNFAVIGVSYLILLFIIKRFSLLKSKGFWLGGIIGAIPLMLFFTYNLITKKSLFPAAGAYLTSGVQQPSYAFFTLNFIPHILQVVFYYFFIIGLIVLIIHLLLSYDRIIKIQKEQANLFFLLLLIINLCFLIFIIKYSEDRYLFESFVSFIFIISFGLNYLYSFIRPYGKYLALIFLIIVLLSGAYYQYEFGDPMIKTKAESYLQMKEAFLWLKSNTPENSVILGSGIDAYIYYSNRLFISPANESMFYSEVNKSDYIVLNAFTSQPQYLVNYAQNNNLSIINAFFFDSEQKQPAIIIYKTNLNFKIKRI